jgi:hypothetical protein
MGDMLVSFDFKSHGEREKNHVGLDKVGGSFLQSADLSAKTLAKVAPPRLTCRQSHSTAVF